eukprot:6589741-Ditylum_brightwellii.AAC.1
MVFAISILLAKTTPANRFFFAVAASLADVLDDVSVLALVAVCVEIPTEVLFWLGMPNKNSDLLTLL